MKIKCTNNGFINLGWHLYTIKHTDGSDIQSCTNCLFHKIKIYGIVTSSWCEKVKGFPGCKTFGGIYMNSDK